MKIQPIEDRVLVLIEAEADLLNPHAVGALGTVIAVGPGRWENGQRVSMQVGVGDRVLCDAYPDRPIMFRSMEHYLIGESEVLAIVRE